jgi:nucleoside-diphosphate-sugar epimerase
MATLVIGAGLVGSQIARILVEHGETPVLMDPAAQPDAIAEIVPLDRVTMIEGSVLRPLEITRAILNHGITRIVHTAANPMLTLGAQKDPYSAIELNIMGTVNVLEAARIHGIKRVVVSSSNVLNHYIEGGEGLGPDGTMNEEAYPRPITFYAATKQAVESLGLNYARHFGMEFAAMRYGAVCGPWTGRGGGGPSNIFRNMVQAALDGAEAVVPAGAMEWVYSKDAARGTVLALQAPRLSTGVFNITVGSLVRAETLAEALTSAIPGARVRIETPKAAALSLKNMEARSDQRRSKEVLGYTPQFDISAAVEDMAAWLRARALKNT